MVDEALLDIGARALSWARAAGADEADTVVARGSEFEVKVADGEIVCLTQATSKGLGLRVFVDKRLGFCTTSDFRPDALRSAVERAVAMAREAAPDTHNGLPDQLGADRIDVSDDLELYDPQVMALTTDEKIRWAHDLEAAARAADPRVTKFRDSGVASGESQSVLMTTTGAVRTIRGSGISLWCNPIAAQNGDLQSEVWWDSRTHVADLLSVEEIGRTAGKRAARMLGARAIPTQDAAVVFEPPMAGGFVTGLLGAIDGDMVYKGASFLADKLGQKIACSQLTLVDDPLKRRGLATTPFDGEGLPTYAKNLVDAGVLTTFLYDVYTARKAGVRSTCSARRSYGGLPSAGTFNLHIAPGSTPAAALLDAPKALLVTRGMGRGVNAVSGEYSRGAGGIWYERGEPVCAVQEVTIAGDFITLLRSIDAIGDDLMARGSVAAPSLRVASMTISGA
jgi:PmbA protein